MILLIFFLVYGKQKGNQSHMLSHVRIKNISTVLKRMAFPQSFLERVSSLLHHPWLGSLSLPLVCAVVIII
jgi:hypothetical protein